MCVLILGRLRDSAPTSARVFLRDFFVCMAQNARM